MSSMPNTVEAQGQLPDPADLLQNLNGLSTDQKKYNHLRDLFLEEADVDEYINYLETDEEIDLTRKQISQLKASLAGYKVYLQEYLKQTGARIGRFDERLKKNTEEYANPDLAPEEVEALARTRKRVAKAMQIAKAPRGAKGKSLKEVTISGTGDKLDQTDAMDEKYHEFLDSLDLSESEKEKLTVMMNPDNFRHAVMTAKEQNPNAKVPSKAEILKQIMAYTPERLKEICEVMEHPKLLIVVAKSFDDRIHAMNEHKHYTSANGNAQENAYDYSNSASSYRNAPVMKKGRVSIVDGVVHPTQLNGVTDEIGGRRDHLTKRFVAKNMRHIDKDEMATLLQNSLIDAQEANDNNLIVDNWETGDGTATIINPETLTKTTDVACAAFSSRSREVYFYDCNPDSHNGRLRGRAAVQVMEF